MEASDLPSGHTTCEEIDESLVVSIDIFAHLGEPILALVERHLKSDDTEGVHVANLINIQRTIDCGTELLVLRYYIADAETSDIEILGTGGCNDCIFLIFSTYIAERSKRVAGHDNAAMNLVGNNLDIVTAADVSHLAQLVDRPDATDRVVWATEDENLGVGQSSLALKILKIDIVGIANLDKLILDEMASVIVY